MGHKILVVLEWSFLLSFWLQTRIDLSRLWPFLSGAPVVSDYLTPFVYLSDVALILYVIASMIDLGLHGGLNPDQWRDNVVHIDVHLLKLICWPMFWFMAFLVVSAISLRLNNDNWWGWWKWLKLFEGGLMVWLVSWRLQNRQAAWRWGIWLLGGLFFESMLLLGEWFRQGSLDWQWLGEWRFDVHTPGVAKVIIHGQEWLRPMGTFAHPNIAGGILALALPVGVVFWNHYLGHVWEAGRRYLIIAQLMWVGFGCLALLVTFSRTAWISVVVVSVWFTAPYLRQGWQELKSWFNVPAWRSRAVSIGFVAAGLTATLLPLVSSRFLSLATNDELSYERRLQLTTVALDAWQHHFWWGVGLNNFIIKLAAYGPLYGIGVWRQPVHNYWLLVGVEVGAFGLACLSLFTALLLGSLVRSWQKYIGEGNDRYHYLIGVWVGWLLLGLADHYWWTSQQGLLVTWLLFGISLNFGHCRIDTPPA